MQLRIQTLEDQARNQRDFIEKHVLYMRSFADFLNQLKMDHLGLRQVCFEANLFSEESMLKVKEKLAAEYAALENATKAAEAETPAELVSP